MAKGNIVDQLLAYDKEVKDRLTGEVTLKLKRFNGAEFTFPIQEIDPELSYELSESLVTMDSKAKTMGMEGTYNFKAMTIVYGCPEVFQNKEIQKKFGASNGRGLVKKILVDGEIKELSDAIDELSGYDGDEENVIDEIKN